MTARVYVDDSPSGVVELDAQDVDFDDEFFEIVDDRYDGALYEIYDTYCD